MRACSLTIARLETLICLAIAPPTRLFIPFPVGLVCALVEVRAFVQDALDVEEHREENDQDTKQYATHNHEWGHFQ